MSIVIRVSHFYLDGEAAFMAGEGFDPGRYLMPDEAEEWRAGWLTASNAAAGEAASHSGTFASRQSA